MHLWHLIILNLLGLISPAFFSSTLWVLTMKECSFKKKKKTMKECSLFTVLMDVNGS